MKKHELIAMTPRDFQYALMAFNETLSRKQKERAELALMVGACVRSKITRISQLINPRNLLPRKHALKEERKMTGQKYTPMSEIRTPEQLKEWHKRIDEDFARVRNSPTYTKTVIGQEEMKRILMEKQ